MVLKTAATSEKAAEGQNAVLEFILLNHPLDCPDCDKGGECPLQDLTFRYGPGSTRMRFPKRTFDKPIPISPLIALDRERCILCYRCTRFSESVVRGRPARRASTAARTSYIATFEDEPYRAHFSGNVVELCPVGALTSTIYRFRARPWEIQNVPTVCGLCPVGCNVWATTREGKVARILCRNHPEIDEGWLCDKGRFAYDHLHAGDRIRRADRPRAPARLRAGVARGGARRRRGGPARGATARSSSRSPAARRVEQADALARLVRAGARVATPRSSRTTATPASTPSARRSSAIRDARGLPRARRRPGRRARAGRRPLAARRPARGRRGDHRPPGRDVAGRRPARPPQVCAALASESPRSGGAARRSRGGCARPAASRSSGRRTTRPAAATLARWLARSGSARAQAPTTSRARRTAAESRRPGDAVGEGRGTSRRPTARSAR